MDPHKIHTLQNDDTRPSGRGESFRNNYLFAPVKTAFRTNPVQYNPVAAAAAFNHGGGGQLHINRLTPAGSCF
jgi:hypothetical protein